jgi:hypothetical protein
MAMAKVPRERRDRATSGRSKWSSPAWKTSARIAEDVRFFWDHAVCAHPDLRPEVDAARALLADRITGAGGASYLVQAQEWFVGRYPNIWYHPDGVLSAMHVNNALAAVLAGTSWAAAGDELVQRTTGHARELRYPVRAEVWIGERVEPENRRAARALIAADALNDMDLKLDACLCADDTPEESYMPRPIFMLTAHRGYTRDHLRAALERACNLLEKQVGSGFSINLPRGAHTRWKHLPALYRLWRENPTSYRPDLLHGRASITGKAFTELAINTTNDQPALQYWIEAFPKTWNRDRIEASTVERAVKSAVDWLAPAPGTSRTP